MPTLRHSRVDHKQGNTSSQHTRMRWCDKHFKVDVPSSLMDDDGDRELSTDATSANARMVQAAAVGIALLAAYASARRPERIRFCDDSLRSFGLGNGVLPCSVLRKRKAASRQLKELY